MRLRATLALKPSDYAWLALAVGITVYEAVAGDEELMTHGARRYMAAHPVLWRAVVLSTAAHLLSLLPSWADPFWRTHTAYMSIRSRAGGFSVRFGRKQSEPPAPHLSWGEPTYGPG